MFSVRILSYCFFFFSFQCTLVITDNLWNGKKTLRKFCIFMKYFAQVNLVLWSFNIRFWIGLKLLFIWSRKKYSMHVAVLAPESCLILCNTMVYPLNSLTKNIKVGYHSLHQGIFLTQRLNLGLLHCKHILSHLSYQGYAYDTPDEPSFGVPKCHYW